MKNPPLCHTLGVPRIGPRRELKTALESHWRGEMSEAALLEVGRTLRAAAWQRQRAAGIDLPASNDFSFYDHVLDAACLVGCVPRRFDRDEPTISLGTTFAIARGGDAGPPLEMTKWFDTNYHHLVPEVEPGTRFRLASPKPFVELEEARSLGIASKPVLLGPLTFLALAKPAPDAPAGWDRLGLLEPLLAVYAEVLARLAAQGATWVELDEPALCLDQSPAFRAALGRAYATLRAAAPQLRLLVATYFGPLGGNLGSLLELPVAGVHVDAVRAPEDLAALIDHLPRGRVLSVGAVDGRNVWRADLARAWSTLERARGRLGNEHVLVAPSCSLLHVPWSLEPETHLPPALRQRLAFAEDKLTEVATLARALRGEPVDGAIQASRAWRPPAAPAAQTAAARDALVELASAGDPSGALARKYPYPARRRVQQEALKLPPLPTTTIGSLPQTREIRALRARLRQGEIDPATYQATVEAETARAIALQVSIGLDVPVHGEFERTDMVEFFADKLAGFALTTQGWVQSYGSRCIRPPIIHGPVTRRGPITTALWRFAQGLTDKPVKGMLTGPVTILKWSFVRDDQPLAVTCAEIARAIRDEAVDLERQGARIIQIDEPGLREALPLAAAARPEYLAWAVACFRMAAGGVSPATQIHTHMCYAELADVFDAVVALDADVLSVEASRSAPDALLPFTRAPYPNELGPGVWDIHAPRVPSPDEMAERLGRLEGAGFPRQRLWLNPDCGLKTRDWTEVEPGLRHLVSAARSLRQATTPYI